MAYTIDPYAELEAFLPKRTVSTIRMLFSGDSPLSPGQKIRLAEACAVLGRGGKATGLADIVALKGEKRILKGNVTDAGVRFFVEPKYAEDALRDTIAQELLPKAKFPQAWRIKRGGGQVKAEIGPPVDA